MGAGAVTLGGSCVVTVKANNLTVGSIDDGGNGYSLTKYGPGMLTLAGSNNTYTGGNVVNGGTLQLSAPGPTQGVSVLDPSGTITINPGATFRTTNYAEIGYSNTMSFVVNGGTLGMNDASFQYVKNITLENGGLWALGTGYAGYQNGANFGGVTITSLASSVTNTVTSRGGLLAGNGGVIFDVQRGTAPIDLVVGVRIFNYNGTGTVTENGNGIVALTASNTYSGATTINGGTLQLGTGISGQDGSIANTSGVADNGNIAFDLAGTQTAAYAISGSGSLTMEGSGTLYLSGSNAYTGGTTVADGTLIVTNNEALVDGTSLTVGDAGLFAPVIPSASAVSPVPEPGTLALLVAGAALMAIFRKRR